MSLFFRANASVNEKIYTVAFLCVGVITIYGLYLGFSPNPETMRYASFVAIPLCLLLAVPLILDRHPKNTIHGGSIFRKMLFYPLILLFSYGFAWAFAVFSMPAIYTHFFGAETTASFQILEKSSGAWKKRCPFYFQLKDMDSEFTTKFCTTSDGWQSLNEGDTAKGLVKKSIFGVIVKQLEPD